VEIVGRYAVAGANIRLHVNTANLGFKRNFERALSLCQGDLIAPSDQDDIWFPNKISALVAVLGDRQLAYCDSTLVDEDGTAVGPDMSALVPMVSSSDPVPFAFGNCVSGHAMLFRRELLKSALPVPADFFHDWWIAAVAASKGGIVFHPESLVLYRQHGANVTEQRLGEMLESAGFKTKRRRGKQPRGTGFRHFHELERRLAAIAKLPGPQQPFAVDVHAAWRRRENQWFSPRLAHLMLKHRRRLLLFANFSEKKARRYSRQLFYGLRLRQLTDAYTYMQP
jgi:hypothetical protein